ncbi:MAG: citrate lyase holo-[acyl-carrier protein] synthase [Anaerorhabdus sp.]
MTKHYIKSDANTAFNEGVKPSLEEVLLHRENRINFQKKILKQFDNCILLALKVNIPGEIKNNKLIEAILLVGIEKLLNKIKALSLDVLYEKTISLNTGIEYFVVINSSDLLTVKKQMIAFEDQDSFGRLLDIDVHSNEKTISRSDIKIPDRKCYICSLSSKVCTRNKTHAKEELQNKIYEILKEEGSVVFNEETH